MSQYKKMKSWGEGGGEFWRQTSPLQGRNLQHTEFLLPLPRLEIPRS